MLQAKLDYLLPALLTFAQVAVCAFVERHHDCSYDDQQALFDCAQPLYALGAISSEKAQSMTWSVFTRRTKDYFEKVCAAFRRFDVCSEPYKDRCFDEADVLEKYKAASVMFYKFLCGEGYSGVVNNFDCFVATLTTKEMMTCQTNMVSDSKRADDQTPMREEREQHVCRTMQSYVDCIRAPVLGNCGIEAWSIIMELIQKPTKIAMPHCRLTANANLASALVLTIAVLLAFEIKHRLLIGR